MLDTIDKLLKKIIDSILKVLRYMIIFLFICLCIETFTNYITSKIINNFYIHKTIKITTAKDFKISNNLGIIKENVKIIHREYNQAIDLNFDILISSDLKDLDTLSNQLKLLSIDLSKLNITSSILTKNNITLNLLNLMDILEIKTNNSKFYLGINRYSKSEIEIYTVIDSVLLNLLNQ